MKRIEHFSIVAHDVGRIFQFISLGTCIPLLVMAVYKEWDMLIPMVSVPVTLFALGTGLSQLPKRDREANMIAALCAVSAIWFVCALIGAFPFTLGIGMPYLDAVFEAMSGWTDTGLTLCQNIDGMPYTLLFWRSLMQWLGGLGIVAFTVALVSRSRLTEFRLYRSEGRSEAFMPSVVSTGFQMWKIYIILTAIGVMLILISGVSLWDALNIAMVAIATGGFSVHSAGIPYYQNTLLELLIIPVMIAGALPFKLYYVMYRRRIRNIFEDEQARLLFVLFAIGIVVITFDLMTFSRLESLSALHQGLFMSATAITSTGFQISYPNQWAGATVLFLTLLMIIGGSSGSTAGGIKLSRIALGIKGLVWWFKRMFVSGKVIVPFKYEGRVIPKNIADLEVSKNMLTIILYIILVFSTTILLLHVQPAPIDTSNVLFEVVSATCNNGISTGFVSAAMTIPSKVAFILIMWIGRLEIVPVIMLLIGLFKGFD